MTHRTRPLGIILQTLDYPPDQNVSAIGLYTKVLAEALAEREHRVYVVSRGVKDCVDSANSITVYRIGPPRPRVPLSMNQVAFLRLASKEFVKEWQYRQKLADKLDELVASKGIDVVEACDSSAEALLYRNAHHPHVPLVVRLHGPTAVCELFDRNVTEISRRAIHFFERRLLLKATHLSAPSLSGANLFRREMALDRKPISVLPNPPTFNLQVTGDLTEADPHLILFVGRITVGKGVVELVDAIPHVLENQPRARFVFAGPDGPTAHQYPSMQAYLFARLPSRYRHAVEFTGYLTHDTLTSYYRRAAICVIPSHFENFGYSCLEAMVFSKAIVGSDQGGMVELLDHGRCGLLYTPPDVAQLGAHLVTLLHQPALRQELGAKARQRVLTHYNRESVVDRIEAYYYRAAAEQAATAAQRAKSPTRQQRAGLRL